MLKNSLSRKLNRFWRELNAEIKVNIENISGRKWNAANSDVYSRLGMLVQYSKIRAETRIWARKTQLVDRFVGGIERALIHAIQEQSQTLEYIHEQERKTLEELFDRGIEAYHGEGEKNRQHYEVVKKKEMESWRFLFDRASKYIGQNIDSALKGLSNDQTKFIKAFANEIGGGKLLPAPVESKGESKNLTQNISHSTSSGSKDETQSAGHPGHCILGTGPDNIVYSYIKKGRLYQRCLLAYGAHKRSVLGLQFLNSERLKEAGCPLYTSRNLSNQILGDITPLKHEICDLASGGEHEVR